MRFGRLAIISVCYPVSTAFVQWESFRSRFSRPRRSGPFKVDPNNWETEFNQNAERGTNGISNGLSNGIPESTQMLGLSPNRRDLEREIDSVKAKRAELLDVLAEVQKRELETEQSLENLEQSLQSLPKGFRVPEDMADMAGPAVGALFGGSIVAGRNFLAQRDEVKNEQQAGRLNEQQAGRLPVENPAAKGKQSINKSSGVSTVHRESLYTALFVCVRQAVPHRCIRRAFLSQVLLVEYWELHLSSRRV